MNLYHVMIDLKDDAKALSFAKALEDWMTYLQGLGLIEKWSLMRRKLNLAADSARDFLLEVEVVDLTQLDRAFRHTSEHSDEVEALYYPVNRMIANADYSLYRPFPDVKRAERVGLL